MAAPVGAGDAVLDRVRALLAHEPAVQEKRMFGGVSFMVHDKLLVATMPGGALLVRVDPARGPELLELPGASQPEMGAGRSMGPSWISVDPASLAADEQLAFWIDVAMAYNRVLRR